MVAQDWRAAWRSKGRLERENAENIWYDVGLAGIPGGSGGGDGGCHNEPRWLRVRRKGRGGRFSIDV